MPLDLSGQALARFKVLDLTRFRAGPTAARQLADWGADVIKVELPPDPGEDTKADPIKARHGPDFQNLHRNKRSLTLNLKAADGLAIFKRLADETDVVIENYRPDVKHRLGIDYETLRASNPRLVYASISGFGQDGPYEKRPGFDQIAQGMGGLMSITGEPGEGPMRVGIPIADLCAGLFCAQAILMALLERERSGEGQWVQTSLLQAQIFMLDFQAARWLMEGHVPGQAGNNHPTSIPTGVFKTSDGYINIASAGQPMWERLRDLLGGRELNSPDFSDLRSRQNHRDRLNALIEANTRTDTCANWIKRLNEAGVPCGEINAIDEVFASPQVKQLAMVWDGPSHERGDTQYLAQPITMSRTQSGLRMAPPRRGQHTDEILATLGYTTDEIKTLRAKSVI